MARALLDSVYSGKVVVLKQLGSVRALRDAARSLLEAELGDPDPPTAAERLDETEFLRGTHRACSGFLAGESFGELWGTVIREVLGEAAVEHSTWDGYKLRAQPPQSLSAAWDSVSLLSTNNPTKSELPMHRDSWGSNICSQVGPRDCGLSLPR